MKLLSIVFSLVLVFFSGCNDNKDISSQTTSVDPSGIWKGYQTSFNPDKSVSLFDMNTIIYKGEFVGISENANIVFSGNYIMDGDRMLINDIDGNETNYDLYTISSGGEYFAHGVASIDILPQTSIIGHYQNSVQQEGEIESYFASTLYNINASLDYIKGTFSEENLNISIDEDGKITGTKSGCYISGDIFIPEEEVNIYKLNFTLNGCAKSGTYSGLGSIAQDEHNATYFLGLATNESRDKMSSLNFFLNTIPVELDPNVATFKQLRRVSSIDDMYQADFSKKTYDSLDTYAADVEEYIEENSDGTYTLSWINFYQTQFKWPMQIDFSDMFKKASRSYPYSEKITYKNINFKGANLDDVKLPSAITYSNLQYSNYGFTYDTEGVFDGVNLTGSDLGGAWVSLFERCHLLFSIGKCVPSTNDALGMSILYSYDDYLSGKSDLEYAVERFAEEFVESGEYLKDKTEETLKGAAKETKKIAKKLKFW